MALECVRQKIKLQDEVSKTQFEMFENQTAITGLTREQGWFSLSVLFGAICAHACYVF